MTLQKIARSLCPMFLKCGHCKREFVASPRQEKRTRCSKKHRPRFGYGCSPECVANIGVKHRKSGKRLPLGKLAVSRVQNAIEKGKLTRPDACEKCGTKPGKSVTGRSLIEGHHEDHTKALEVKWLCRQCHRNITPTCRGERHKMSKFTEEDVHRIRRLLALDYGINELGKMFGVTHKAISDVRDGSTWRWLK